MPHVVFTTDVCDLNGFVGNILIVRVVTFEIGNLLADDQVRNDDSLFDVAIFVKGDPTAVTLQNVRFSFERIHDTKPDVVRRKPTAE